MGKPTGFLEYDRYIPKKRPPEERIQDWGEMKGHCSEDEIKTQASRCMDCGVPFCQSGIMLNGMVAGCPLHNLIPQWNHLVYQGKWEEAYKRLSRTHPFPEFTARVCPAPCEGSCTEGHVTKAVTICNIEYAIIERAFANGWVKAEKGPATGKRIAVIGSGPAGLSAAWNLAIKGHDVTVYERQDEAGGLLMYGIPNMKLDKSVVKRRLDLMKQMGIQFQCNVEIGVDIKTSDLMEEYDSVLLAIGATSGRKLNVPGVTAKGVFMAVDYLKANTKQVLNQSYTIDSAMDAMDKHVIVIGGGDTGTDCVGTALRQGAASVHQFEITSKPSISRNDDSNPWPEWPRTLNTDYGQEEAIHVFGNDPRVYETNTTEIMVDDFGAVTGIKTVKVEWVKEGERLIPKSVPGSEQVWKADLILIAMGFVGPERTIIDQLGLAVDSRGNILADSKTFETSRHNVFACGDARRGQSLVVWGIAEGKRAAEAMDHLVMAR